MNPMTAVARVPTRARRTAQAVLRTQLRVLKMRRLLRLKALTPPRAPEVLRPAPTALERGLAARRTQILKVTQQVRQNHKLESLRPGCAAYQEVGGA